MSSWTLNNPRTLTAEAATSSTRELRTIGDLFLADRGAVAVKRSAIEISPCTVLARRMLRSRSVENGNLS